MDETKIYVRGKSGFKQAIKLRIADTWEHRGSEVDADTIMFLLPAEFQMKSFKASLGEELIAGYDLQFLTNLGEQDTPAGGNEFFPMTIWSNKDSNLKSRTDQMSRPDPHTLVF
jgi:hypothetical protein